ncbi:hypothetical protein L2747_00145 [Shewanella marinintestina]|uniref:hypothetical protein n=1 Tax=Shewanella marinintestina TaxID=190305 RepID=UPI002010631C|nr:hypothetical protein [Shewanella marinintestina]MCL1144437.1 hypothetical protein [Shewanella marinintestina]
MQVTRQQHLQDKGIASQVISSDVVSILSENVQASIKLTNRVLLSRYLNPDQISSLALLSHKSESLELHRSVLSTQMNKAQRVILLSYITQNLETLDEAIAMQ